MLLSEEGDDSRDEAGVAERSPERLGLFRRHGGLLVDHGDLDLAELGVDLGQGGLVEDGRIRSRT